MVPGQHVFEKDRAVDVPQIIVDDFIRQLEVNQIRKPSITHVLLQGILRVRKIVEVQKLPAAQAMDSELE